MKPSSYMLRTTPGGWNTHPSVLTTTSKSSGLFRPGLAGRCGHTYTMLSPPSFNFLSFSQHEV